MKLNVFIFLILIFTACAPKEKAIQYGHDACHFCRMNIVDKIHGAEIVNSKGKAFMYDAIECLIRDIQDNPDRDIALYLVNHYETPEALINAKQATYLISPNLPSPMGAYLTAFKSKEEANRVQQEKGGKIYNWETLQAAIKR